MLQTCLHTIYIIIMLIINDLSRMTKYLCKHIWTVGWSLLRMDYKPTRYCSQFCRYIFYLQFHFPRGEDIGLQITLVPKILNKFSPLLTQEFWVLLSNLIGWFRTSTVQPIIFIYKTGNFDDHYRLLSLISLTITKKQISSVIPI